MLNHCRKNLFLNVSLGILISLGLAACGLAHKDPLLTESPKKVANFLYRAQMAAMDKIKLYDMSQMAYLSCLQDERHFDSPFQQTSHHRCDDLFQAMADYAHDDAKDPDHDTFENVTLSDLKNQKLYQKIQANFMNEVMQNQ